MKPTEYKTLCEVATIGNNKYLKIDDLLITLLKLKDQITIASLITSLEELKGDK